MLSTTWPCFLWGPPGVGKSSVVRQVAESRELRVIDIRAPLLDPTDLRGIPAVVDGRAVGTSEFFEIETSLVLPAVGYRSSGLEGLPFNDDWGVAISDEGRAGDGLYVVGWIKRGPTGVIGTNRPDGQEAAKQILEDIPVGSKPGRTALEAALAAKGTRIVNYDDWQVLDAHEKANARDGAPREKEITVAAMLEVLDGA